MSENPKSVEAIREEGNVRIEELDAEYLEDLEAEVAEMHRLAELDKAVGH